jgi:membrane-bound lytic murein transglycosylase D
MKNAILFALAAVLGSVASAADTNPGATITPPNSPGVSIPLTPSVAAAAISAPAAAEVTQAAAQVPGTPAATPAPSPAAAAPAAADAADADDNSDDADAPDEPAIQKEVQAESAELEQMRAAEEKAHVAEQAVPEDPAARAANRLGLESPLRLRLRDAFGRETGRGPELTGRIALLPEIDHDLRHLQAEFDIPIEVNPQVVSYVRFFQSPAVRKHFVKWLGRSSKYIPVFRKIMREQGLPEDTVYLSMIESGFANLATSRARAVGPWQFMPSTGKRMGLKQDFWVDERRDPQKAAVAAAKYLKELYGQTNDWRLSWAGYNAGVGKIFKAQRRGQQDFWAMARGRVLKRETKGYVPKLMACAIITKHPEEFGFTKAEIEAEQWQDYDEVTIPRATALSAVAQAAGVDEKALLDLNPELRRTCTPPRPYTMKVPKGQGEVFAKNWPSVDESAGKLAFAQHRVERGETLRVIATHYRVDQGTIARMNGLRIGRRLKPGTEVVIPLNALARSQGPAFASAERPERESVRARRSIRKASLSIRAPAEVAGRARSTVQVREGDSLWGIARRFGVALEELCRWNGIRNPRRFKLQAGRSLVVYPRRSEANSSNGTGASRSG